MGAGSGRDQREGIQGEDAGDGIVSWGAQTVIQGNMVHVKEGHDARIGIHVEALGDRHDPIDHGAVVPDSGAVISGNIVIGHGLDARNGRWRRGIVDEGVENCQIVGNYVVGGGWWAISSSMTTDEGNIVIADNNIIWVRPEVDITGGDWSPSRAAIAVLNNVASGRGYSAVVANNNIDVQGHLNQGIYLTTFGGDGLAMTRVVGNAVRQNGGVFASALLRSSLNHEELVLAENVFRGNALPGAVANVIVQNQHSHLTITGNIIENEGVDNHCLQVAGGTAVVTGNSIRGGLDGGQFINMTGGVIVSGNTIRDTADDGLDMFGTDPFIISDNIFTGITGTYVANGTPSATRIDTDNIKN